VSAPAGEAREVLALVHHHPGRLRLCAAALRGPDSAEGARAALFVEPGVTLFSHNPRTGSVLIEYEPGLADVEAIIATVAAAAGLDPPTDDRGARPRRREPALVAIHAARELNEAAYDLTGYRADLRTLVPTWLVALAVYSFAFSKERRLPRWDNLFYWSYNIFSHLHRHEIDRSAAMRKPAP
jgi:hypothetical protein